MFGLNWTSAKKEVKVLEEEKTPKVHPAMKYDPEVLEKTCQLPRHVQRLRETILDESFTILARFESDIRTTPPDSFCGQYCGVPCHEPEHNDWSNNFDWHRVLSTARISDEEVKDVQSVKHWAEETYMKARILKRLRHNERAWDDFYYKQFFEKLQESHKPQNFNPSQVARSRFYYDSFEISKDAFWTAFEKPFDCDTCPKPDLVAHFKLHHEDTEIPASARERWQWRSKAKSSVANNFSRPVMLHLHEKGLAPSAFKRFANEKKRKSQAEHEQTMLGYPWLVAEYKCEEQNRHDEVYIQAANAARCVLQMYSNLVHVGNASDCNRKSNDSRIPPLVTVTGVENEVKVWIAWSVSERVGKDPTTELSRMKCIWEGDMRVFKDVIKFQSILENVHTWAMRDLRGTISAYLDQWLFEYPLPEPAPPIKVEADFDISTIATPPSTGYFSLPTSPEQFHDAVEAAVEMRMQEFIAGIEQLKLSSKSARHATPISRATSVDPEVDLCDSPSAKKASRSTIKKSTSTLNKRERRPSISKESLKGEEVAVKVEDTTEMTSFSAVDQHNGTTIKKEEVFFHGIHAKLSGTFPGDEDDEIERSRHLSPSTPKHGRRSSSRQRGQSPENNGLE